MPLILTQFLDPQAILLNLAAKNRDTVLLELTSALQRVAKDLDREAIVKALADRERDGTTGIGMGVAIPHTRLKGLEKIHLAFGRSLAGIEFGAIDEKPVDLFFLLIAPEESSYLKILARLSQLCQNPAFCQKLRTSQNEDEVFAILTKGG